MSWRKVTIMSQRIEFVKMALQEGTNISELCRRFGISRKTGYKFLNRYKMFGVEGLFDLPKCPVHSPNQTSQEVEQLILDLRDKHSAWGGRKLKRRLEDMGYSQLPSPSTITAILKRNGRICEEESVKHKSWERFEAPSPNDLWQMDFKGHFQVREGRCHPLTVLDDHSRFSICINACENEKKQTVQDALTGVFRKYGLPYAMLIDNGPPWQRHGEIEYTSFTVWLMRLGISVIHSRPLHPQTLGKDERFHRTMKAEVIPKCIDKSIIQCQQFFEDWRIVYNTERPHEAIDMEVPSKVYNVSNRIFPEKIEEIEYGPDDYVRKVQDGGRICFKNKEYKVSKAFKGQRIAIRPQNVDGMFDVYFCCYKIAHIDLNE